MSEDKKIIFSMVKVSKQTPQGKQIIKDIHLSFYYGAKIGILGLNGAGKSTVMKIIAGIDKRNAILIESSLLKFANNAAVITIPDLDTPGIIANVCINPIKIMVYMLIFANVVTTSFFLRSAKYKITANNIVIEAIEKIERMF